MTEVKCRIPKNEKFLDGIWDLSAPRREAEFAKILAGDTFLGQEIACKQALQGALEGGMGGREKEGELATTSLELKSRCEMLIGGDDISDDITTRGTCLSMFVYIRARYCVALIGGNLTAQSTVSNMGIGSGIQITETYLKALLPFPAPPPERPGELASRPAKKTPTVFGIEVTKVWDVGLS